MPEMVSALKDTPIPTILVVGGILFLLLSVADQLGGKITVTPTRQKWAGIVGGVLITSGVILYLLPTSPPTSSTTPASNATSLSSPTVENPSTAAPRPVSTSASTTPAVLAGQQSTSAPALPQASGAMAGVFEFKWPGNDCWDIYRGEEFVDYQCGSAKEALQAGTYTIKPRGAKVFIPFEVSIKSGSITSIEMGGIFEFKWPGNDCWDIYRGEEFVDYQCGSAKEALQAGTYTIKPRGAKVFSPFEVKIQNSSTVSVP